MTFSEHILYQQQLIALVQSSERLMNALRAVRTLGLPSWCIGAGAIRSLVWDALHRFQTPTVVDDMDVAYFDADAPLAQDRLIQHWLTSINPSINWEAVNQAKVHEWYPSVFGQAVSAFTSLEDGIASWPEYATCVGVYLDSDDSLHVVAPHGLSDLFEMQVRHNPQRANFETFVQRVQTKRFTDKWPKTTLCDQ